MPARRFGHYEVLARLATGGAANIFLARRTGEGGLAQLVVLKTLLPERAADQEFVDMFLDEARLAARITHPNCVEILDLGREGGTYYIAMELIEGETLWSLLSTVAEVRAPLPPLVVTSILASAAEALHHAHELLNPAGRPYNLVHRDISPQNIMVSYAGQTKVLDFGVAKAETGRAATLTGVVKGKFSYMSPEQISGAPVDRKSDVYSLGIVMFECLASRRLYRAEDPEEIAKMMLERKAPRLADFVPDVDPRLEAICAKSLARHPSARFATAKEMAEALRAYLHARRFPEGPAPIARLVEERFGTRIAERRRVLAAALEGSYDETELLRLLNARPVMEIDLASGPELAMPLFGSRTVVEIEGDTPEAPAAGEMLDAGSLLDGGGTDVTDPFVERTASTQLEAGEIEIDGRPIVPLPGAAHATIAEPTTLEAVGVRAPSPGEGAGVPARGLPHPIPRRAPTPTGAETPFDDEADREETTDGGEEGTERETDAHREPSLLPIAVSVVPLVAPESPPMSSAGVLGARLVSPVVVPRVPLMEIGSPTPDRTAPPVVTDRVPTDFSATAPAVRASPASNGSPSPGVDAAMLPPPPLPGPAQSYSLGVVMVALGIGVGVGLLLGLLVTMLG
ncbi:MAG: serine/threonine protein kinase [Deltaproteobacteria bacterium]|nr:serine/threonine protein kinase [Deltaproteobacteria bacterium]